MQHDVQLRNTYGNKATDNVFKLLLHTTMVIYGYLVIRNTPCHHFWLGGTENYHQLIIGVPNQEDPCDHSLLLYCLIAHGYHFAALVRHFMYVDSNMSDYEGLMIHHVATNMLMLSSNYAGNHRAGCIVVILHDVVDIFVAIARIGNSLEG